LRTAARVDRRDEPRRLALVVGRASAPRGRPASRAPSAQHPGTRGPPRAILPSKDRASNVRNSVELLAQVPFDGGSVFAPRCWLRRALELLEKRN